MLTRNPFKLILITRRLFLMLISTVNRYSRWACRSFAPKRSSLFIRSFFSSPVPQAVKNTPLATKPSTSAGRFYEELATVQKANEAHLLMARVGDFYEFYFDQARLVSRVLGLKLARSANTKNEHVFCGFPMYKRNDYVRALLQSGYSVAKFEQYEIYQANGQRILTRKVDRIYTAGTLVEEEFINYDSQGQYVVCVHSDPSDRSGHVGFASIDLASGEFHIDSCHSDDFIAKLSCIHPLEWIQSEQFCHTYPVLAESIPQTFSSIVNKTTKSNHFFRKEFAYTYLHKLYDLPAMSFSTTTINPEKHVKAMERLLKRHQILQPTMSDVGVQAAAALLDYIVQSHCGILPLLDKPEPFQKDIMVIDTDCQRALEIHRPQRYNSNTGATPNDVGDRTNRPLTLLSLMDKTKTPFGAKLLKERLSAPSANLQVIEDRLNLVQFFYDGPSFANQLREILGECLQLDAGRAMQNLRYGYAGPWHLGVIMETLRGLQRISSLFQTQSTKQSRRGASENEGFDSLQKLTSQIQVPLHLLQLLEKALPQPVVDGETSLSELPKTLNRPGLIRADANRELQEALDAYEHLLEKKNALREQIKLELPGSVLSVELESKKPLGAFIEIEVASAASDTTSLFPTTSNVQHLQTLGGGSARSKRKRYRHPLWMQLESDLTRSYSNYLETERLAFGRICQIILEQRDSLMMSLKAVASLDVGSSMSVLAHQWHWTRPKLEEEGRVFEVHKGKHPVVEAALFAKCRQFKSNSCLLNVDDIARKHSTPSDLQVITGANMGGKSVYLRQNALIAIMAQSGSFVPASKARLSIVDRLFCRIGASDDLAMHQSTFMMEMLESAHLLRRATPRSLLIMDEVGRGTSSMDGSCLAFAILKYVYLNIQCRALFATHYHDLLNRIHSDTDLRLNVVCEKENQTASETQRTGLIQFWRTKVVVADRSTLCLEEEVKDSTGVDKKSLLSGEIYFLHELEPGLCENSYGIHVAQLAGLPTEVILTAQRELQRANLPQIKD